MSDERWEIYEKIAQQAVRAFSDLLGISVVEGKQRLLGKSGTSWVVDAKAERLGGGFFVLEFKSGISSGLSQIEMAGIAFAIKDTDANGGILVSVLPPQKGAKLIAQHEGIRFVFLPQESTLEEFVARCMEVFLVKVPSSHFTLSAGFSGEYVQVLEKPEPGN